MEACEVEGIKVCESFKEATKERACWIEDSQCESNSVGDGEELLGDKGERIQVATYVAVVRVVVVEDFFGYI